jgi:NAD(P)-dependent dehydrogenase (short-subunit alcohol dehydrogenase family)
LYLAADAPLRAPHRRIIPITATGGGATAALLGVTRAADVERLLEDALRTHGRLDYMFNNASIGVAEVRDLSLDDWRKCIDIDLWGAIYGTTAGYAAMLRQGTGHIVNMASAAGLIGELAWRPILSRRAPWGLFPRRCARRARVWACGSA